MSEPHHSMLARFGGRCAAGLVDLCCRWPRLTLIVFLLAAVASAWGAVHGLRIDTSTEEMLSPDLPFRKSAVEIERAFPMLGETLVIVVQGEDRVSTETAAAALASWMAERPEVFTEVFYPEGDPFLKREGLLYLSVDELDALIERLISAQGLISSLAVDPTMRGLADVLTLAVDSGENIDDLGDAITAFADVADARAAGEAAAVDWRDLLTPETDEQTPFRLIVAQPSLDYGSLSPARVAMAAVAKGVDSLQLQEMGVDVAITGKPAIKAEELETIRSNIVGIGLLSFGLVALIIAYALRSWRGCLAVGTLLVIGLALTAGFAWLAIGRLNLMSVAFAVLFIGLSVDYGLHYLLRAGEDRLMGLSIADALGLAAREQGPALLLCATTSALAFLSFLPTDYIGLGELGLISAFGIGVALFLAFTLLPAMLSLSGWRVRVRGEMRTARLWEHSVVEHRRYVLAGAALLALVAVWPASKIDFDDDPLSLRDPDSPAIVALARVVSDPRAEPYRAEILRPDLESAVALAAELEKLPEVDAAVTAQNLVPKDQDEKLDMLADAQFFLAPLLSPPAPVAPLDDAGRREAALKLAQSLLDAPDTLQPEARRLAAALAAVADDPAALAEMEEALIGDLPVLLSDLADALSAEGFGEEDLPDSLLRRYLSPKGLARIDVRPALDLRDGTARRQFAEAVLTLAPDAAGDAIVVTEARNAVIESFLEAGLYALLAATVVVLLVLRRVGDLLMTLAPLFLAVLLTAAATWLLGLHLNFANVIVLPLLFGLGIDSSLHLVARRRAEPDRALLDNSSPRAIVFSALSTIASFGSLALSAHPGTASMGLLLMVALIAVLAAVFLLLPALMGHSASDVKAGRPEIAAGGGAE